MWLMVFGLALFSGVHLLPAMPGDIRTVLVDKLGPLPFKGLFSVLALLSIACIVLGWNRALPVPVYAPPPWGRHAAFLLVLMAFVLFVTPYIKSNVRRSLRHPQLSGVILWSIGHLLANGDSRSLLLFTWLALWAILEMFMINRREGEWRKPPVVPVKIDLLAILGGFILYLLFLAGHPYIAGIRLVSF